MSQHSEKLTVDTVVHQIDLQVIDQHSGGSAAVRVGLEYVVADPWAVSLVFATAIGPLRWDFARELLADGLHDHVGEGDVHLWPCLDADCRAVVMIELEGADGGLVELQAPSRQVAAFVAASHAAVPAGAEHRHVDLDALVGDLLTDA